MTAEPGARGEPTRGAPGYHRPMTAIRRTAPLLVLLGALAGCGSSSPTTKSTTAAPAAAVASAKVAIANYKFVPPVVTLKQGGRITFSNQDKDSHTATSDDGSSFDSGTLKAGQSKTLRFAKAGAFSYHCSFHAFMVAKVVVVA
jgi:plastocyanin